MGQPLVSVAMPVRNAEATLPEALESLQRQDLKSFEIVVVDHGSTDSTPDLLHKASARDSRIQVHRWEGTFVEAANLAWQRSTGEWIARMDADDVCDSTRLSEQIAFLQANPNLDACGTLVRIRKRGNTPFTSLPADGGYARYEEWVNSVRSPTEIKGERFVDSPVPNPTSMIRRETLLELGGFEDPTWAEDYDFWLRFLEGGYRVAKVPKVLLDWYDSPTRSTRSIPRYELEQFQLAKAHYLSRLSSIQKFGAVIWGAGPIGKQMARFLQSKGIKVPYFVEVDPKKIGNTILGAPVISTSCLPDRLSSSILLAAVGVVGARDEIRENVAKLDRREGIDFFCVA
ncbi:MAG: glycosyltransferase [Verrucomicrobiota bacterium]